MHFYTLVLLIVLAPTFVWADQEPNYCSVPAFKSHEVSYSADARKLQRLHVYQLGNVKLAGLAIGLSDANAITRMQQDYSSVGPADKYCTFYFNSGNLSAERAFSHHHLPFPAHQSATTTANIYGNTFASILEEIPNFLTCAEAGTITMGCNGMMHRGPTVFGMLLSFSGCQPEHAAAIVNSIWGLNGVPRNNRLAAIRRGYELGLANPESSERLRSLFDTE